MQTFARWGIALLASLAFVAPVGAWETPERGTDLRGDLMDALRPRAEWAFGAPLVFRVDELRVAETPDGTVAFAMVEPIRPDGRAMTRADLRHPEEDDPFDFGGPQVTALLELSGRTWVATHWVLGATEAWWYWDPLCPKWHPVIPEACAR